MKYRSRVTKITNPFDEVNEVELHGEGLVLGFNSAAVPGVEWRDFTVPMTAAGNWTNTSTGEAATKEDFQKVLADLKQLLIRGEFNTGPDSGWLDKVSLEEGR